jgi:hypothetical protein
MHERHTDRELYFREQSQTTSKYVIPFISGVRQVTPPFPFLRLDAVKGETSSPSLKPGAQGLQG